MYSKVTKLTRNRLSEQVAIEIENLIMEGKLNPGDQLPTELEFAEQFGASRTVIREAVKVLSAKGLVTTQSGKGTFVTALGPDTLSVPMRLFFRMGENAYEDLQEVRETLEPRIAVLAAQRAIPEDLDQMRVALDRMREHVGNMPEFIAADRDFHVALATATRNRMFLVLVDSIVGALQDEMRVVFHMSAEGPKRAIEEHRRICEAIASKDVAAAQKATEHHLNRVRIDIESARQTLLQSAVK